MKILFVTTAALSVLFSSLLGVNSVSSPTVVSIRAFEEPLVSINGDKDSINDGALIEALQLFQQRKSFEDLSAITAYLEAHPSSPWRFSLLANMGIIYRKTGYFSKALDTWEQAWSLGKSDKTFQAQGLANRVAAELSSLLSSLGRTEKLASLLAETNNRFIYGASMTEIQSSKENLWLMRNRTGESFKCGPYALDSIKTFLNPKEAWHKSLRDSRSTTKGFSLTQVRNLSNSSKMFYQMAKRQFGAPLIVPSVAHWKSGHYSAVLKRDGDQFLTTDPTFRQKSLISVQALEDESSGYFLIPGGPLPEGWKAVSDEEGATVWGQGAVAGRNPTNTKGDDHKCTTCPPTNGMAVYNILTMLVSLSIQDTPVGYSAPIGPDTHFTITYNQYENNPLSSFSFFNFGPRWNCNWLSYVVVPPVTGNTLTVFLRGGGQETYDYTKYNMTTATGYVGFYGYEVQSQAAIWVTSAGTYERRLSDGSKEVYGKIDPSGRAFLSQIVDPQGNSVHLEYDGSFRLMTVTDAQNGEPTRLFYELSPSTPDPSNPLTYLVTKIKDPFGRSATFSYTASAPFQLTDITDVVGITSHFNYGAGTSDITSMLTPYGTTQFFSSSGDDTTPVRTLKVIEPDGSQVYAESRLDGNNYPYPTNYDPIVLVPSFAATGIHFDNASLLHYRNTYYWDKEAMKDTLNNPQSSYIKSHIYHWVHNDMGDIAEAGILESERSALENRIWYAYSGQYYTISPPSSSRPIVVARVIGNPGDPGTLPTQAYRYQYGISANPRLVTAYIDPAGRKTDFYYDTNNVDLISVKQETTHGFDTLLVISYTDGSTSVPAHCPAYVTDVAGQVTHYEYNSQGQTIKITPPSRATHPAEPTLYSYTGNFLTSITKPLAGAVTTVTPDTLGGFTINRVKTIADAVASAAGGGSYTRQYTYDNLDRVTQVKYPDATTQIFSYVNPATNAFGVANAVDLDLHSSTDRQSRSTTRVYNPVRQLTSINDPLGRTTAFHWCTCGSMDMLTDARGKITYFNRDLEGRLVSKVYPGDTQPPSSDDYEYDTIGRVSKFHNKRHDVTSYAYNIDSTNSSLSYALGGGSTSVSTPPVYYTYDGDYPRLTIAGDVAMTYRDAGTLGAGQVSTVTNTFSSGAAVITYSYDEWGRKVGRNIDGANLESIGYDPLGRVSSITSLLGTFTNNYFDPSHPTDRLGTVTYPNGQSTVYDYYGISGDERLKEIKNLRPSSGLLSQHDYAYNTEGTIATWDQKTDANPTMRWIEGYDAADQLTTAALFCVGASGPAVRSDNHGYDAAGNMTSNIIGTVLRSGITYNDKNQLTGSTASGNQTVRFVGQINTAGTVKVNGSPAIFNGAHYFNGAAILAPGTTTDVAVVATDVNGNSRTNSYHTVVPPEPSYTPVTYDADGNELSNGAGQSYTWDAKNQLKSITYAGVATTAFTYDALGRRTKIVESGSPGSSKIFVWDGNVMAEERASDGTTVKKQFFGQGERVAGSNNYFTRDHLGSVREILNSIGNVQARYCYDPFGQSTLISGTNLSDFQYAGYYVHQPSGLYLTFCRLFDSRTARWLSRDPLSDGTNISVELEEGKNLYQYVNNNPVGFRDIMGLTVYMITSTGNLGSVGHGALVSGNGSNYTFQSFGLGMSGFDGYQEKSFRGPNALKRVSDYIKSQGYSLVNQWNTCPAQDKAASDAFKMASDGGYTPGNNCQDAVNAALNAAGVPYFPSNSPLSAALFNSNLSNSHYAVR